MDFLKEDVIKVAKALISESVIWDNGNSGCMNPRDGYECLHCNASEYQIESKLKHSLDCPVLIAKDLLTGSE